MIWRSLIVVGSLTLAFAAQGEESATTTYSLDVTFFPEESRLEATADIDLSVHPDGPAPLHFYLHGELAVQQVLSGGREVPFTQRHVLYDHDYSLVARRIDLEPVDTGKRLSIRYAGHFHPSKARSPSDYMRIDRDGVLLRAYGYSLWFPVFLDAGSDSVRADFRATLRVPDRLRPVFVGHRLDERVADGWRVSRWRADDTDLFSAQCSARAWTTSSRGSVTLYHAPDDDSSRAARAIGQLAERLEAAFRTRYRKSAVSAPLHLMEMPRYGDISSGNVVGMQREAWVSFEDSPGGARLLAHELVHPFVQLETPRDDPLYALAVEGLPAYFHLPVLAGLGQADEVDARLRRIERAYLQRRTAAESSDRDRRLPPQKPLIAITADEVGRYKDGFVLGDRALLFFEWVRRRLGPSGFAALSRDLFAETRQTYEGFLAVLDRHLGDGAADVRVWLETDEFPERFRLPPAGG